MDSNEQVPQPPVLRDALAPFPPEMQEQWRRAYAAKLKEQLDDEPDREIAMRRENVERRHWKALRAANKLLEVPNCTAYEQAVALKDWQAIFRQVQGSELAVVTIDGKKFRFPVPEQAAR